MQNFPGRIASLDPSVFVPLMQALQTGMVQEGQVGEAGVATAKSCARSTQHRTALHRTGTSQESGGAVWQVPASDRCHGG